MEAQKMDVEIPGPSQALMQLVLRAVRDFELIVSGDRIAVGLSGGKDSILLALVLRTLQERGDFDFEWTGVHLDQAQPGFERAGFDHIMERCGIPCEVVREDTHSVVQANLKPGQIPCSICSRMRRGILNRWCEENGFNKLAMGHHLDDAVETFFLNLLFQRKLEPLKALTPSQAGVSTIRPMILVEERKVEAWVTDAGISPVACPVCDDYPLSQRRNIKEMLRSFEALQPEFRASVRDALYNART